MESDLGEYCERCGYCCTNTHIEATKNDLERWNSQGRADVIENTIPLKNGKRILRIRSDDTCSFLGKKDGKYTCAIHETKPEICSSYPYNLQGELYTFKECSIPIK